MWAEKRPNGRFRGSYRDNHGNTKHIPGTFTKRADALRKAAAKENEVRARRGPDVSRENAKLTIGEWMPVFWATRKVEPGTAKKDESNRNNHILPYWAELRLRDVTREDVQEWVDALAVTRSMQGSRRRLKASTVRRIYMIFKAMYAGAITGAPALPYTPCVGIELPVIEPPDEYFLTRDEFARMVAQAPSDDMEMWAYLAVGTGMRYGEVMGLHRERIDLEHRKVTVQEAWDQTMREIKGYPKSRKPRGIPITDELAARLRRYMDAHEARPCTLPHRSPEGTEQVSCRGTLLFEPPAEGTDWRGSKFRLDSWLPMVRAAKLEHVTPHDLRHTYASWMIQGNPTTGQRGLTLDEVSELLGHSSVLVTKRYAHLAGVHWDRAREVMGGGTPDPEPAAPAESAPFVLPETAEEQGAKIIQFDRSRRSTG